jgi:glycosyl hydrolase family 26
MPHGPRLSLGAAGLLIAAGLAWLLLWGWGGWGGGSDRHEIYWGAWISGETYAREGEEPAPDAPGSEQTWDEFAANAGREPTIVHFGQPAPWSQPFEAEPFERVAAHGAIPFVDMDPDGTTLAEIASGSKDGYLEEWADAARRYGRPFFLRWAWEMNGHWFQWGQEADDDPALYVAAWRHFHDVVAGAGADNVTWVWCPHVSGSETTPFAELYPGDEYVDWTCMDGYNWGASGGGGEFGGWRSFASIFGRTYGELLALAPEKPIMIGETASSEGGDPGAKAGWIENALGSELPQRFPQVDALVWFNWNIPSEASDERLQWPIESSPAAQAAFAAAIASPDYVDAGAEPELPALSPVPPPR